MSADGHDLQKEKAKYYKIYGILLVLTVVTVLISNFKVGVVMAVVLALAVATLKAGLVGSFFMHLAAEKKIIYHILIMTVPLAIMLMLLTAAHLYDVPEGTYYFEQPMPQTASHGTNAGADVPENEGGHH